MYVDGLSVIYVLLTIAWLISVCRIRIQSRMWDACLVIDGGMSFKFNDGAVATFEIAKDNAIRTVDFE